MKTIHKEEVKWGFFARWTLKIFKPLWKMRYFGWILFRSLVIFSSCMKNLFYAVACRFPAETAKNRSKSGPKCTHTLLVHLSLALGKSSFCEIHVLLFVFLTDIFIVCFRLKSLLGNFSYALPSIVLTDYISSFKFPEIQPLFVGDVYNRSTFYWRSVKTKSFWN